MTKRFGTLITLKPGTTKDEAEATLALIKNLPCVEAFMVQGWNGDQHPYPKMHEYNEDHGSPVFYIP